MRIFSLEIQGYKMFNPSPKIKLGKEFQLLIGVNGSGKSTVLEAIAILFAEVKKYCENPRSYERQFNFFIEYSYNSQEIIEETTTTQDSVTTINHVTLSSSKESGLDYTMYVNKNLIDDPHEMYNYLPDNLIFYYAGFCDTLEKIVKESEERQAQKLFRLKDHTKIRQVISSLSKNLVYVDKKYYPVLFLLNFIDRKGELPITKKKFTISNITFYLQRPEGFNQGDPRTLYNLSGFLRSYVNNILSFSYGIEVEEDENGEPYFNLDFHLGLFEAIRMLPDLTDRQRFEQERFLSFHFLSLLFTIGLIKNISVSISDENENQYNINELSEGEQQLITIDAIKNTLVQDNSVLFLDEPDAFLHPQRQREIIPHIKSIFTQSFVQTIVTSHSPFVAQSFDTESVVLFAKGGKIKRIVDDEVESYSAISDELFGISSPFSIEVEKLFKEFRRIRNKAAHGEKIKVEELQRVISQLQSHGDEVKAVINREVNQLLRLDKDILGNG